MAIPSFQNIAAAVLKEKIKELPKSILTFDPGETTGWSSWAKEIDAKEPPKLVKWGQLNTKTLRNAIELEESVKNLLMGSNDTSRPNVVVIEDYRIYEWKTDEHAWSSVHTIQLIGLIKTYCIQNNIPYVMQSAQIAKQFATDEKLKDWDFWQPGMRHARDAIRHGIYYILFNSQKKFNDEGYVV